MTRRSVLVLLGTTIGWSRIAVAAPAVIEVYKSPTCGCCGRWMDHLRQNGFQTRVTDVPDAELPAFKTKHGVPGSVQSCHTAIFEGYVIEGHVPASAIRRLLNERPRLLGIGVAGMPRGAPGMEVWGQPPQPYQVTAFDKAGKVWLFASYGA